MPTLSLNLGFSLIILGMAAFYGTGNTEITALVPVFFGVIFSIFGFLAKRGVVPHKFIQAAAGLSLLGVLIGIKSIPGLVNIVKGIYVPHPLLVYAFTAMMLMCLVFLVKAVNYLKKTEQENGN